MKSLILNVVVVMLIIYPKTLANALSKRASEKYTTRYDNIDIDHIVQSKRLLTSYVNCLLEKGPCTTEGKELKSE